MGTGEVALFEGPIHRLVELRKRIPSQRLHGCDQLTAFGSLWGLHRLRDSVVPTPGNGGVLLPILLLLLFVLSTKQR